MLSNWDDTQVTIPARLEDVIEDTLRQVTKIHRRRVVNKVCATAASVFALVGVFLAVGFTNPAMASQIPFLGKIFENASSKGGPVATNLAGYDAMQYIGKKADSDNENYSLTVREAYSDGATVQIGLEMTVPQDAGLREIENSYGRTSLAKIGGEEAKILAVNPFHETAGLWTSTMSVQVPESQRDKDKLEVALTLRDFTGIEGEFAVETAVLVDKAHSVSFECLAEDNGAKVLGVDVSPTQTVISLVKPYWGDVLPDDLPQGFPYLYTRDGTQLYRQPHRSADEGGYEYDLKEEQSADLYFAGPPAGTKELVLRFIYGDYSDEVLAEFTIDLEKQTVRQGSELDDSSPYFYEMLQGGLQTPDEITEYVVANLCFDKMYNRASVALYTPVREGGEALRMDVTREDGRLLMSSTSVGEDGAPNEDWHLDNTMQAEYTVSGPALEMPPKGTTATVTLASIDSGKVIYSGEVLLDLAHR